MGVIKRKNPSGRVVYGIQWIDEHGQRQRQFDRSWNEKLAKAELAIIERRRLDGVATRPEMTVADLFADWHRNHVVVTCSPVYVKDAERQFRLRIGPLIGHRRIDTVNRHIVRQMVAQMQQVMRQREPGNEYAGHATINKTLTVVKGMFTYAVQIDQIATNPAHGVPELPEEPTRRIDAWPVKAVHAIAHEVLHLGDGLPEFQRGQRSPWVGQRDYTIVMLAAFTGLRQSELLGLHWDQVDDEWLHVTHKLCRVSFTRLDTKSKRGRRRVPLMTATRSLLDAWRAVGAHPTIVFPNQDGSDYVRAEHFSNKSWDKARKRTKPVVVNGSRYDCATMTFHELRHTFISLCLAAGRDLWEVANWAGDDPELVKRTYGHYMPDSLGDTRRLDRVLSTRAMLLPAAPDIEVQIGR
ncbi:MAG: site-specific integrase [Thermoleophilia bacterium]|nr:site-specific integrase [Thermoleophilia bacterium]